MVQAVSTQLAEFTEGIDTVSTLEASNLVELAAQSGGRILELKIRQGDEVAPGQLLVVLDQVEKKAKADNAKACLLYTSPSPRDRPLSRMPSSA